MLLEIFASRARAYKSYHPFGSFHKCQVPSPLLFKWMQCVVCAVCALCMCERVLWVSVFSVACNHSIFSSDMERQVLVYAHCEIICILINNIIFSNELRNTGMVEMGKRCIWFHFHTYLLLLIELLHFEWGSYENPLCICTGPNRRLWSTRCSVWAAERLPESNRVYPSSSRPPNGSLFRTLMNERRNWNCTKIDYCIWWFLNYHNLEFRYCKMFVMVRFI